LPTNRIRQGWSREPRQSKDVGHNHFLLTLAETRLQQDPRAKRSGGWRSASRPYNDGKGFDFSLDRLPVGGFKGRVLVRVNDATPQDGAIVPAHLGTAQRRRHIEVPPLVRRGRVLRRRARARKFVLEAEYFNIFQAS
jgi:hypothetical protein